MCSRRDDVKLSGLAACLLLNSLRDESAPPGNSSVHGRILIQDVGAGRGQIPWESAVSRTRRECGLGTTNLGIALDAQEIPVTNRPWSGSVLTPSGGPIVPIFDGWYPNPDGTSTLCFGYYSVNYEEDVDIPLENNNFVEPRQYDGKQPDHFEHIPERPFSYRRRYCVFPQVPADFGPDDESCGLCRGAGRSRRPSRGRSGPLDHRPDNRRACDARRERA